MFGRIRGAVARSEAHGHATMNDAQALMAFIREVVKAGAADLDEAAEEFKKTVKEVKDGVTIETKIKVDWAAFIKISASLKLGLVPDVNELPLTLVNRIILEEKA